MIYSIKRYTSYLFYVPRVGSFLAVSQTREDMPPVIQDGFGDRDPADFLINNIDTPLLEKGYKGVFESLPEEKQTEFIGRKTAFAKAAEIYL